MPKEECTHKKWREEPVYPTNACESKVCTSCGFRMYRPTETKLKTVGYYKAIVLSGNRNEYESFLSDNRKKETEYIDGSSTSKIAGVQVKEVIVFGTFWTSRRNADRLHAAAMTRIV